MEAYRIVLESQLGPREGTLRLEETKAGVIAGSILLLGVENAACGKWIDARSFQLSHHLRTQVSDLECISKFELDGDKIFGTLHNEKSAMLWHGEKATVQKGANGRNVGD